ncbi:hypothetical protein [Paraburkholderia unamae]|uniref:Uncharacterized protein n=1 Tax=Paraburkholderia unamae TaxID=219649 RepID=A0ABX5KUM7_9BURK|nr:hypothetical protein [Paraburkholderia unamae]PVX85598.1 hypothetical protein C7402_103175 [Paraburkholderia unamae]RAR56463.1 hypothetical protein C7401_119112 [Paraburkholderia unamae]CAG9268232.1 Collagenase-like protease, PrtC family [Paraburkholderia unamae]
MKISLGALAARWNRSDSFAFYDAVALSSVDVVYVGIAVRGVQGGLQQRDCLAVARELSSGGKEVVLSVRAGADLPGSEDAHAWIEDCELPVEVGDARTFRLLAGKVPLVMGAGMPCASAVELRRLVELGARRRVMTAVCKGEVAQALACAVESRCEMELPVLSPRRFARWRCRVEACNYEGWPLHAMPGCDLAASPDETAPDWASDLDELRRAGVGVLRVTPRDTGDIGLSQALCEWVRGDIDARAAYAEYAASPERSRVRVPGALHPWQRSIFQRIYARVR